MDKEQMMVKAAEIKGKIDSLVIQLNDQRLEGTVDPSIEKSIGDMVNEYTSLMRGVCFEELKAIGDPVAIMNEACRRLTFVSIRARDTADETGEIKVKSIEPVDVVIDLGKLHTYCGKIGSDPKWIYAVEKLNMLLTCRMAEELGLDPKSINDTYAMAEISKSYDLGKNPASKTKLLDTLNSIFAMMLGEGVKANTHDVNFLLAIYAKKGRRALAVACANHKLFRNYVQEIAYRHLNGLTYDVEYKKAKK